MTNTVVTASSRRRFYTGGSPFRPTAAGPAQPLTADTWLAELRALNDQRQSSESAPASLAPCWIFAGLGTVLGAAFMAGLLFYDGSRQINVTLLLLLVGVQLGLALLTSLQAWLGWQPWASLLGRTAEQGDPLQPLRPALSARIAHTGGLMFAISGLLTLLAMVTVQDLAFGWSTTLQASPRATTGWCPWLPCQGSRSGRRHFPVPSWWPPRSTTGLAITR